MCEYVGLAGETFKGVVRCLARAVPARGPRLVKKDKKTAIMGLRKTCLRRQRGFTLIEIVAVLIIMGILAAVAARKFIDLNSEAEAKAVETAVSELNGRATVQLAKWMLDNSQDPRGFTTELGADFILTANTNIVFNGNNYTLTYTMPSTASLASATPANWER